MIKCDMDGKSPSERTGAFEPFKVSVAYGSCTVGGLVEVRCARRRFVPFQWRLKTKSWLIFRPVFITYLLLPSR